MKRFRSIKSMQNKAIELRQKGAKIGFVPTMGFLHEGHLSLVRRSVKKSDISVVSIFVNPTQFAPGEDFEQYPRDMKRDLELLNDLGVDYVFTPGADVLYPEPYNTFVSVNSLTESGEGASRPAHFTGVTTVVTKLLNIVQPHFMFMGQKDIQQAVILRKMAKDLNMPVKVEICPTQREKDGLAMSSRNVYLTGEYRSDAVALIRSLRAAENMVKFGETNTVNIRRKMQAEFRKYPAVVPEYILFADGESFTEIGKIAARAIIAVAAKAGKTRLIDNIIVSPKK